MRALETAREGLAGGLRRSEPNNNSIEISYQPGSTNLPLKFQICLFIPFLPSLIGETNCKQTKHCHSCLIFSFSLLGIRSQILSDLSLSFTPHSPSPQLWYHQHALVFLFFWMKFISSPAITLWARNVCREFKMNFTVKLNFHVIPRDLSSCAGNGEVSFLSLFY